MGKGILVVLVFSFVNFFVGVFSGGGSLYLLLPFRESPKGWFKCLIRPRSVTRLAAAALEVPLILYVSGCVHLVKIWMFLD